MVLQAGDRLIMWRWMPPVGQHRAAAASLHARRQPHTITPVWHASSTHAAACTERRSLDALLVAATGPEPRTCFCCRCLPQHRFHPCWHVCLRLGLATDQHRCSPRLAPHPYPFLLLPCPTICLVGPFVLVDATAACLAVKANVALLSRAVCQHIWLASKNQTNSHPVAAALS